MEALNLLENKISALLDIVKRLKAENGGLKKECEQLGVERTRLAEEKAKLEEINAALRKEVGQLTTRLESVEGALLTNDENMDKLNQEKTETKVLIDELIKDIDSLVESENQR